eukprot:GHVH01010514.1.p1 GENE.GHVH01010514.1~~GHVH01010514.1.p1  ORF type:complete len:358 (+),score=30.96 GHVH01010514.1:24-1076(+)
MTASAAVRNGLEIEEKSHGNIKQQELSLINKIGIILGIYLCFLLYGISQEHLFSTGQDGDRFRFGNFLIFGVVLSNLVFCSLRLTFKLGFDGLIKLIKSFDHKMLYEMSVVSLTSTVAMVCTASALEYVNLPTQVLMKSGKSVPVIAGNFIKGRRYPWYDNATVLVVSISLVMFNFAKTSSNKNTQSNSAFGLGLLSLSLIMDGITGPKQDTIVDRYAPSSDELMLIQNAFSMIYSIILWFSLDGLAAPISFVLWHPDAMRWLLIYCICGVGGQFCIYKAIVHFGSLHVSLITTVRKFFTVLMSVLIFGHNLNHSQWLAVSGIFGALAMQSVFKNKAAQARMKQTHGKTI